MHGLLYAAGGVKSKKEEQKKDLYVIVYTEAIKTGIVFFKKGY